MSVIERAEQRLAEEERQHEMGADNQYNLHYWAAYLDGARAQKKEGGELAMSALNYVERQGFVAGMDYAGMTEEERETLLKELRDLPVGSVTPLVVEHDYTKLVEALRLCQFGECGCGKCYYKELKGDWCTEDNHPEFFDCDDKLKLDAAAAIEELIESVHIRDKHLDELNHHIWKLEAEVKQLKECNDELREAQTYIDHYGDKWLTSAKDVPTSAYNHGYMDGKNEAEQAQLPKRGEWITIRLNNGGSYTGCSCCEAPIPTDTMLDYIPESESKYCYSCGAKMEVQDG